MQLPADSEHSAIFQCLQGVPEGGLRRVILTASGGAFRDMSKDELFRMCTEEAEAIQAKATTHPNWDSTCYFVVVVFVALRAVLTESVQCVRPHAQACR